MSSEILKSDKESAEYKTLLNIRLGQLAIFTLKVIIEHGDEFAFTLPEDRIVES